ATVAHNFDEVTELRQVGVIALGGPVGRFSNQTPRLAGWGRRNTDGLDLGWLEIMPAAVPELISTWGRAFVTFDPFGLDPGPTGSGAPTTRSSSPSSARGCERSTCAATSCANGSACFERTFRSWPQPSTQCSPHPRKGLALLWLLHRDHRARHDHYPSRLLRS